MTPIDYGQLCIYIIAGANTKKVIQGDKLTNTIKETIFLKCFQETWRQEREQKNENRITTRKLKINWQT